MTLTRSVLVAAAAGLVLAGCSDPYAGRAEVSGTVQFKGQAIKDGAVIEFAPLEGQDTGANAVVTGGAFLIPRQSGLKPGRYLIRVTAGDGVTPERPAGPDDAPGPSGRGSTNIVSRDLVPPEWGRDSKKEVTVGKDGPNRFEFAIP
jgi:hypothetical protein